MDLVFFAVVVVLFGIGGVESSRVAAEVDRIEENSQKASIYVSLDASTWKKRGRLFYDIEGSILKKLKFAGFEVIRDGANPHDYTLSVIYREDRGEQYAKVAYGTIIHSEFRLSHQNADTLLEFAITEISENEVSGPPPYLDVLQKFQTNPYYYFSGDILQGRVNKNVGLQKALIFALERHFSDKTERVNSQDSLAAHRSEDPPHSMDTPRNLYGSIAVRRAIDNIVFAKDVQAIPVLLSLVRYPDTGVRVRAIESLGTFHVQEAREQLTELAKVDREPQVRKAAETVLKLLTGSTSIQAP